jgi:hypothetical protein
VVGIEGGVLLSAAYVLTRRLWLAIGIHFGWDFSQDAIFGVGKGAKGLVVGELSGPALLSGGERRHRGLFRSAAGMLGSRRVPASMRPQAGELRRARKGSRKAEGSALSGLGDPNFSERR